MAVAADGVDNKLVAFKNLMQGCASETGMPPIEINLPQIVVVGSQSAGKSSLLENLVGRSFLPRGTGIKTRRPLVLRMVHDPKKEYGEFSHVEGKFDYDGIRQEIEKETENVAKGKLVSAVPINLRIRSPRELELTLVDLPGLTLVPVAGQPDDIEDQIRDIVLQYARDSDALILAVSPANVDLANSAALKLAKQVDPQGLRTFSVITKLDLMPQDEQWQLAAQDIFLNKLVPLKLGHWGVINTSREAEEEFFDNSATYRHCDIYKQCGTAKLEVALNEQLQAQADVDKPARANEAEEERNYSPDDPFAGSPSPTLRY